MNFFILAGFIGYFGFVTYSYSVELIGREFHDKNMKKLRAIEHNTGPYGLSENQINTLLFIFQQRIYFDEVIEKVEALLLSELSRIVESNISANPLTLSHTGKGDQKSLSADQSEQVALPLVPALKRKLELLSSDQSQQAVLTLAPVKGLLSWAGSISSRSSSLPAVQSEPQVSTQKKLTPEIIAQKFTPEVQETMVKRFVYQEQNGQEIVKTLLIVLDNMGLIVPSLKSDIRGLQLDLSAGSLERYWIINDIPFALRILEDPEILQLRQHRDQPQFLFTYRRYINKELRYMDSVLRNPAYSSEEKQILRQFWARTTFSYGVQKRLFDFAFNKPRIVPSFYRGRQRKARRILKKLNDLGVLYSDFQSRGLLQLIGVKKVPSSQCVRAWTDSA